MFATISCFYNRNEQFLLYSLYLPASDSLMIYKHKNTAIRWRRMHYSALFIYLFTYLLTYLFSYMYSLIH